MSAGPPWRWRGPAALALGWFGLWVVHISWSDSFVLATGLQDDTFYYLLPAWNFSRFGWFTFDGLTTSYGFQPLWELCLVPLAFLLPSREALLRGSLVLGAGCYALTAIGIARAASLLASRTGRSGAGWASFVAGLILLVNTPVQLSNLTGKENALYGLLFVVLLNLRLEDNGPSRPRLAFLEGVLAGLILLARVTPMSLTFVALQPFIRTDGSSRFGFAARYVAGAALVMTPWIAYATMAFGSPVPTSAFVRTDGLTAYLAAGGPGIHAGAQAVWAYLDSCVRFSLGLASNFWDAPRRFDLAGPLAVPVLVLVGLASLAVALPRRERGKREAHVLLVVLSILAATAVIPFLLSRDPADMYYRRWYIVELPVLVALVGGAGAGAVARISHRIPRYGRAGLLCLCFLWFGGGALDTYVAARPVPVYTDRGRWQDVTLRAAVWSNRALGLTREDRVGAFSAGLLGWVSNATVVNLDGLANDEVARALRGGWSMDRYCAYRGIRVYIDAVDPALLFARSAVRVTFPNESREFPIYYVAEIGRPAFDHPGGAQ